VEGDALTFTRVHSNNQVTVILSLFSDHGGDTSEHLGEVPLNILDLLGVTDDFEQVFVTHEVESSEVLPLLLQIVTERFLDMLELGDKVDQSLLQVVDLEDLEDLGLFIHGLHQFDELTVNVLEFVEFVCQH